MNDFRLKLILSLLSGVVFSFIFILLAFILPVKEKQSKLIIKPKGTLEKVSISAKKRLDD